MGKEEWGIWFKGQIEAFEQFLRSTHSLSMLRRNAMSLYVAVLQERRAHEMTKLQLEEVRRLIAREGESDA